MKQPSLNRMAPDDPATGRKALATLRLALGALSFLKGYTRRPLNARQTRTAIEILPSTPEKFKNLHLDKHPSLEQIQPMLSFQKNEWLDNGSQLAGSRGNTLSDRTLKLVGRLVF